MRTLQIGLQQLQLARFGSTGNVGDGAPVFPASHGHVLLTLSVPQAEKRQYLFNMQAEVGSNDLGNHRTSPDLLTLISQQMKKKDVCLITMEARKSPARDLSLVESYFTRSEYP